MSKTQFSISAVHRMTGIARSTIAKHIKKKDISVVKDQNGNRLIDASELIRVYGDRIELDEDGNIKTETRRTKKNESVIEQAESPIWKELYEAEKEERKREIAQMAETVEHLREQLVNADEREKHHRLLLQDKSQDSDLWQEELKELKQRAANQETETRKYRYALIEELRKSWWAKLLGIEKPKKKRKSNNLPPQAQSFQG